LFTQISAGYTSSCAVEGGAAFCWGSDGTGQIGNGATTGDQTTPQPVSGAITFAQLSISGFHVVGRESGGQAHGWGDNDNGQVGDGRTTDQDVPVFVAATTN
jgi:serine/threonine-protein kinase